jgi:hypothetical protein
VIPEVVVRIVVPLGNTRVKVDVRAEGDAEDETSTAEVKELPNVVVDVQGRVEVSEHPAQTVRVVAQAGPQVVTVEVTVLAFSS